MAQINLKKFLPKLRQKVISGKSYIFDPVRKKYILLQPEELIRQLFIQYLVGSKGYSLNLMNVEKTILVNEILRRFDIVVYDKRANPLILVECKEYGMNISEKAFHQIAAYNLALRVDYLVVTNGWETYYFKMDYENLDFNKVEDIPGAGELHK